MNKLVFIFISKRINIEDIYNYLCHNGWINKDSNINIDLYGDEKLYKALKPPVKLIVSIIGCLLVAAAVIILIIAYMPR